MRITQNRVQQKIVQNQSGQAILEYILMVIVAVFMSAALSRGLLTVFDDGILTFGAALESRLKTGRTPTSVWEN